MNTTEILKNIAQRTGGDIYLENSRTSPCRQINIY